MKYPQKNKTLSLADILQLDYQRVNVAGRNPDVDQASDPEDLWALGGLWVPPTNAEIHNIVSDSALDVGQLVSSGVSSLGGGRTLFDSNADFVTDGVVKGDTVLNDSTGEYSVAVFVATNSVICEPVTSSVFFNDGDSYRIVSSPSGGASVLCISSLNSNFSQRRNFYILNGLTPVPTLPIFRINQSLVCGAADRAVSNAGEILITDTVGGAVTDVIIASEGIGSTASFSVPRGYTAYIATINMSMLEVTNAGASISLILTRYSTISKTGSIRVRLLDLSASGGNVATREFTPMLAMSELTDIVIRCSSVTANNTDVSGTFSVFLVKN